MENITRKQIRDLSTAAGAHGDLEMVAICDRALDGDAEAIAIVVHVIEDAEAQED